MSIKFTRYHLPNGRQTEELIERAPDVESKAQAFIDCGGYFEMEQLRTGEFSLTAEHDNADGATVAIELCSESGIGAALDRLVETAVAHLGELIDPEELAGMDLEDQLDVLMGVPLKDPCDAP